MALMASIRTTTGKPWRGIPLMAALLTACVLLVWAVTRVKSERAIDLEPPIDISGLPLRISPPAGWLIAQAQQPQPGLVAVFVEFDAENQEILQRRLQIYQFTGPSISPAGVLARLFPALGGAALTETTLGPLPARQALTATRDRYGNVQKHLLRTAAVSSNQYIVLRLDCLGPPTPWEYRLMDRICGSTQLEESLFAPPAELAAPFGISFARQPDGWIGKLEPAQADRLTLLPAADAGWWGAAQIRTDPIPPAANLEQVLRTALDRPGRYQFESIDVGPVKVTRARLANGSTVQLIYLFRPSAGDAAPSDEPSADDAAPAPSASRAAAINAWSGLDDENAADKAIRELIAIIQPAP